MSTSFPISSEGVDPLISSLTRASLRDKAEEIVNRLDQEEQLLSDMEMHPTTTQPSFLLTQQNQQQPSLVPPNSLSPPHAHHRPMSLLSSYSSSSFSHQTMPRDDDYGQQVMLIPIIESPGMEDISPSYPAKSPLSHHSSELLQFSSFGGSGLRYGEFDGPGLGSQPSIDEDDLVSVPRSSKKQELLYPLKPVSMYMYAVFSRPIYLRIMLGY